MVDLQIAISKCFALTSEYTKPNYTKSNVGLSNNCKNLRINFIIIIIYIYTCVCVYVCMCIIVKLHHELLI